MQINSLVKLSVELGTPQGDNDLFFGNEKRWSKKELKRKKKCPDTNERNEVQGFTRGDEVYSCNPIESSSLLQDPKVQSSRLVVTQVLKD